MPVRWGVNGVVHRFHVPYFAGMQAPKTKATAAKLRSWRATILRARSEHLGAVEAPDAKTAEQVAIKTFGLEGQRRQRPWYASRISTVSATRPKPPPPRPPRPPPPPPSP
jgi:hypothetical protein